MILQKRPHFVLRDGSVHFLNAERPLPPLSEDALGLFTQLQDGRLTDPSPAAAVKELTNRGVADLIAPIADTDRRRVLVIEPHGDDAALSIGALMWQRRKELDFTLITCASRSNYTSSFHTGRAFFDRDAVSDLRRMEGETFMAHLGGEYRVLDLPEATMRYADADWSVDFFLAHRTSVAMNNNRRASDAVLARWVAAIEPHIIDPSYTEIWLPLGAGTHSDHDLTRNAALTVLIDNPEIMARAVVRFYKDVPYGIDYPEHTERLLQALRHAGAVIEADTVDITDAFDRKLELLGIFASQFKPSHVAGGVQRSANMDAAPNRHVEHLWRMVKAPHTLDTVGMFIETLAARERRVALENWSRGGSGVRNLRVLALAASGNWKADEALLRDMFPNARLSVYASPATRAEIAERKSDDVALHDVGRGTQAWIILALRLALARPAHTLFIAGDGFAKAHHLARMWPLGRNLIVRTMDHLTLNRL